jgi:general secretion pathway protein G
MSRANHLLFFAVLTLSKRQNERTHRRARNGFTLIEILVVIAVVAVLAALVAPNVFRHVGAAKDAAARSQMEMLGAALDAYRLDNGRYPTTAQGLAALWEQPNVEPQPANWRGPYLRKRVPPDPWGIRTFTPTPANRIPGATTCCRWAPTDSPPGRGRMPISPAGCHNNASQ